jgi:hypothetical protein
MPQQWSGDRATTELASHLSREPIRSFELSLLIWYHRIVEVATPGGSMSHVVDIQLEMPADLARFRLAAGVNARLQELLDRQDRGEVLSAKERREAEGLVNLVDLLTLLRLGAERVKRTRKNHR